MIIFCTFAYIRYLENGCKISIKTENYRWQTIDLAGMSGLTRDYYTYVYLVKSSCAIRSTISVAL